MCFVRPRQNTAFWLKFPQEKKKIFIADIPKISAKFGKISLVVSKSSSSLFHRNFETDLKSSFLPILTLFSFSL